MAIKISHNSKTLINIKVIKPLRLRHKANNLALCHIYTLLYMTVL